MKKSLRNLAKVAAGLGAAYALTKMGKTEPSEADSLRMQNQADQEDASRAAFAKKNARISDAQRLSNQAAEEDASRAAFAKANQPSLKENQATAFKTFNPIGRAAESMQLGMPEEETVASAETLNPRGRLKKRLGAKKGKMMMASRGGSVIARGNKLTRNKPTQLF